MVHESAPRYYAQNGDQHYAPFFFCRFDGRDTKGYAQYPTI